MAVPTEFGDHNGEAGAYRRATAQGALAIYVTRFRGRAVDLLAKCFWLGRPGEYPGLRLRTHFGPNCVRRVPRVALRDAEGLSLPVQAGQYLEAVEELCLSMAPTSHHRSVRQPGAIHSISARILRSCGDS